MHNDAAGYQLRIFDPRVRIQGIPGKGGIVPDGLVVDATDATEEFEVSSVQVRMRNEIPKNAEAIRILFDWKATRTKPDQVDVPVATSRVTERVYDEAQRRYRFWVFDFLANYLKEGQGTERMEILLKSPDRKLPGSIDLQFGPDFAIPAGWRVEITGFRVELMDPREVPPTGFPAEAESFVAWYGRHHRGTPINLSW